MKLKARKIGVWLTLLLLGGCHWVMDSIMPDITTGVSQTAYVPTSFDFDCIKSVLEKTKEVDEIHYQENAQGKKYIYYLKWDDAERRELKMRKSRDGTFSELRHGASFKGGRGISKWKRKEEKQKISTISRNVEESCQVKFSIFSDEKTGSEKLRGIEKFHNHIK